MTETIAAGIARSLAEKIVTGELPPGAPLRQDHIAEEFAASHVPVREAFQRLQAQGLVVSEPRRGVRVAPLDQASMREFAEIRAHLEALALRHAAPKLNAGSFEKIELALIAGDQATSIVEWELANRSFHRELVAPCNMPRLLAMLDELQLVNSRFIFAATRTAGWQPGSGHAHRQIVDALKLHEVDKAVLLLQKHIQGLEHVEDA